VHQLRDTLRFTYAPFLLIGVNGLAFWGIASGQAPWKIAWLLLAAIAVSFAAERIRPYSADWNQSHGDRARDTVHALVNEASNFSTLLLLPLFTQLSPASTQWPSEQPFVLQVLLSILVLDAGITLAHYASHRAPLLWKFHAVHHSVRRMYGFNGLMKHPIHQSIETLAGTLPLIVLGLPTDVALALVFAVAIQLLLQHSNVDYTVGPLRYILATSEVHRFHHLKVAALGDVNFGLFTTLWDHLLGTYHFEDREQFSSEELGIGAEPDYPTGYLSQLLEPFRQKGSDQVVAVEP
jgi:sterol desaturase/sphingolipid hydroxylase (fatty acid hydroxylase superfamily)